MKRKPNRTKAQVAFRFAPDVIELLDDRAETTGYDKTRLCEDALRHWLTQPFMDDLVQKRRELLSGDPRPKSNAPDPQLDLFDAEEPLCLINGIEGVRGSTPRGSTSQSREVARKLIDLSGVRIEVLSEESRGRHCRGGGGELHFAQAA